MDASGAALHRSAFSSRCTSCARRLRHTLGTRVINCRQFDLQKPERLGSSDVLGNLFQRIAHEHGRMAITVIFLLHRCCETSNINHQQHGVECMRGMAAVAGKATGAQA